MDFSFLNKKINILAIDDDHDILELHKNFMNEYIPYNVTVSSSLQQAETFIIKKKRFHACVMDLGMHSDEFYLLRKYHNQIPFIVVTGSNSFEKGVKVKELGAFDAMSKGSLDISEIIKRINKTVIKGIFLKRCNFSDNTMFNDAFELIFKNESITVSELARQCFSSESNMRRIWRNNFNISPKKMSLIFEVLQVAFDYYNFLFDNNKQPEEVDINSIFPQEKLQRIKRYCSKITPLIIEYF